MSGGLNDDTCIYGKLLILFMPIPREKMENKLRENNHVRRILYISGDDKCDLLQPLDSRYTVKFSENLEAPIWLEVTQF